MNMERLPLEVITHIMRFLTFEERCLCSVVCKSFYSASQAPVFNSRLICHLHLYDDLKKCLDVACYAHRRSITHLSIHDSCPGHVERKCQGEDLFWAGREKKFWTHIANEFRMITTIHLSKLAHKKLQLDILLNIGTSFTSLNTLKLHSTLLFDVLSETANFQQVLKALQDIPQLLVILESQSYSKLPQLLDFSLKIHCLFIEDAVFILEIGNEMFTAFKSPSYYHPFRNSVSLSVLSSFCSRFGCAVRYEKVDVNLPELKLSEITSVLRSIPKLRINKLVLHYCLSSVSEDESPCLNQISELGVTSLSLACRCYIHDWFSNAFFESATLNCKAFKEILCYGKFDQRTLDLILSHCPFIQSVHIVGNYIQTFGHTECTSIRVTFRSVCNGHLRVLNITMDDTLRDVPIPFQGLQYVPYMLWHLQEFELNVNSNKFNHQTIFMKLRDHCPNIRKIQIRFHKTGGSEDLGNSKNKGVIHMNHFNRMAKLEEVELCHFELLIISGIEKLSYPSLKHLNLLGCSTSKIDSLGKIASACQGLKVLNLCNWKNFGSDILRTALIYLKSLEELHLLHCKNVNSLTLQILSSYAPPLRLLTLSQYYKGFESHVKMYKVKHPNVHVILYEHNIDCMGVNLDRIVLNLS